MGALHEGHLSLIRAAKTQCNAVAVSIFVNPLQFGPKEDLAKYPRPFERDVRLLEAEKIDAVFAPGAEEMYPQVRSQSPLSPKAGEDGAPEVAEESEIQKLRNSEHRS